MSFSPNSSLNITPLKDADVDAAYEVFAGMHQNAWSFESFVESLATSRCLIAKNQDVLGLVLCNVVFEQAELLFIGVSSQARRTGVAMALLTAAMDDVKAQGATSLFLEVDINNHAAQALYKKADFNIIDTRKNYYQHADGTKTNALIMQCTL